MKTYKNKYILPVLAAALYCMTAAGFGQKDSTITLPWNEQRTYYQTTGSYLSIKGNSLDGKMMGDLRNRPPVSSRDWMSRNFQAVSQHRVTRCIR